MGIVLRNIIEKLDKYSPIVHLPHGDQLPIRAIQLIEEEQRAYAPDILYICKPANIPGDMPLSRPITLLSFFDGPDKVINKDINLIVIKSSLDFSSVHNELLDIFFKQQGAGLKYEKFVETLLYTKGLENIIKAGYEFIKNPIIMTDSAYKYLFSYSRCEVKDIYWEELTENGYFSVQTAANIRLQKLNEIIDKSPEPLYLGDKYFKFPRIISKIDVEDKRTAVLAVYEYDKKFEEIDYKLVSLLCERISMEMHKNRYYQITRGFIYEPFLIDLFGGKVSEPDIINIRAKSLNLSLKENLYVLTIKSNHMLDTDISHTNYLRRHLAQILPDGKSIVLNGAIVMLLTKESEISIQQYDIQKLQEFLSKNLIYGGVSRCFSNLADSQKYYRQSQKAIEFGIQIKKEDRLFFYEDYTMHLFFKVCQKQNDLREFCHSSIFKLMGYDHNNHTVLMDTLKTYLAHERGLCEAANALGIHRNTLKQRMESIKKITEVNLDDPEIRLKLLLSFQILDFIKDNALYS